MPCLLYDSILYFTMLTIIYFICNAMSARHVRLWASGCVIGPACMDGLRAHPPCVPSMRAAMAKALSGNTAVRPINAGPVGHKKSPRDVFVRGLLWKRGGYLLSHFRSIIGVVRFNFSVRDG